MLHYYYDKIKEFISLNKNICEFTKYVLTFILFWCIFKTDIRYSHSNL